MKTNDSAQELCGHVPPGVSSAPPDMQPNGFINSADPIGSLAKVLYPLSLYEYPGRMQAMARLLGVAVGTYERVAKPCGGARLGLPLVTAAEKLCEVKIAELSTILAELRARKRVLNASTASKRRGFLTVRVRDQSGVPRNAQGNGRGNEPGF